jgi:hypothetical protein
MTFEEFRERLTRWSTVVDSQPYPSSHKTRDIALPEDRLNPSFWNSAKTHMQIGTRDVAYLGAYWECFGDEFSIVGVPYDDQGYCVPDKAVVSTLNRHDAIVVESGQARLTSAGHRILSSVLLGDR